MKRPLFLAFLVPVVAAATASPAWAGGPITKGPWVQHVTSASAVVRVEVDPPGPATLEVGMMGPTVAEAGSPNVIESRTKQSVHSFLLKGLEPAKRYPIAVRANGGQRYGAFTTAPREDSGASFRFLVYGDNRSDDAAHAAVERGMETARSDLLINTGDLVERGNSATQWQTFFDIESPLMRERPIFACVGNHELTDGSGVEFIRYFGPANLPPAALTPSLTLTGSALPATSPSTVTLDELSGTFRWSNARFFLVNGMVRYESGPTREWLDKVLDDSDSEPGLVWRIVVVHHGPWSSGPHGDNTLLQEAKIPDLLRKHKVDLVISGHDHIYERGSADGLPYLVSGGGGSPVYRVKKAQATSRHYESVHHFVEASASDAGIQFAAIRADGSVIERCGLRKGTGGWDCDGAQSEIDAGPPPSAPAPRSKCGCRAVGEAAGARSDGAIVLFVAAAAAALFSRLSRRRSVR